MNKLIDINKIFSCYWISLFAKNHLKLHLKLFKFSVILENFNKLINYFIDNCIMFISEGFHYTKIYISDIFLYILEFFYTRLCGLLYTKVKPDVFLHISLRLASLNYTLLKEHLTRFYKLNKFDLLKMLWPFFDYSPM